MAVNRRLVAVVVADVVGYSRLMERDEAGTHERLRALNQELIAPKIAEHGGRAVKTIGDGMLLEFPSANSARLLEAVPGFTIARYQARFHPTSTPAIDRARHCAPRCGTAQGRCARVIANIRWH